MNLSDLLKENRIRRIEPDHKQAADCLKASERDIKVAKKLLREDLDWSFSVAYNAALQSVRALMFADGYCAIGEEYHKTIILYSLIKFGRVLKGEMELFDRFRKKRSEAIYFSVGTISEFEAKKAIDFAELISEKVKEKINSS